MRSIESTGKTVEEAVQAGLGKLGLELSDVTISVIEEGSKGFFGLFGAKPAKVRITERDQEPDIDMSQILRPGASTRVSTIADKPRQPKPQAKPQPAAQPKPQQPKPAPQPVKPQTQTQTAPVQAKPAPAPAKPQTPAQAKPAPVQPKPQQPKPQAQPKADKPQAAKPAQPKPQPPKPPRAPRPAQPRPEIARPAIPDGPLPDQDPTTLSELGRRAYEYLDKLTKLMGVPVKIYVAEAEGSMSISMMGDTLGILIGRRGDTLDALQYLTSLEVNRDREEYVRVSLDTEHYRAKREESLTRLAARMADRTVKTGRKVVLEPMNPYERRVLHATLQDHPYVQTHSEGDEPNRRVVITLKSDAPQPDGDAARPAKRAPRPERRDQKPGERQSRPPRADKPRPPRPVRPEKDAVKPAAPVDVPMAHDVPEDPTDDTI